MLDSVLEANDCSENVELLEKCAKHEYVNDDLDQYIKQIILNTSETYDKWKLGLNSF